MYPLQTLKLTQSRQAPSKSVFVYAIHPEITTSASSSPHRISEDSSDIGFGKYGIASDQEEGKTPPY